MKKLGSFGVRGEVDLSCSAPSNGYKRIDLANINPLTGNQYPETRELLDRYKRYVRNDLRRILKGRVAETVKVKIVESNSNTPLWPSTVWDRLKALEMRGLSTQPFIEMLKLPPDQRPTTLTECIDFFYPESGFTSVNEDISPFVGTGIWNYILGYDEQGEPIANEDEGGNVPLQLGEITMMYGWFLVFRLLLCPNRFSGIDIPPTTIFQRLDGNRVRNIGVLSAAERELQEDINKLNQISKVVDVVKAGSLAYINSEIVLESTDDFIDLAQEMLNEDTLKQFAIAGVSQITSLIAKNIGFPEALANDVAVMLVEGAMDPDKWENLKAFKNINFDTVSSMFEKAKSRAYQVTVGYFNTKFDDLFQISGLSTFETGQYASILYDFFATAEVTPDLFQQIERIPNEDLKRQMYDYISTASTRVTEKFRDTYFDVPLRENPAGITLAVAATTALIQGGISYSKKLSNNEFNKMKRYYTERIYTLPETLTVDSPFAFEFSDHIRKGIIEEGYWVWEDDEFKVKPTCELQQGGQMLEYWSNVFAKFRPILNNVRTAYREGQGRFNFWTASFDVNDTVYKNFNYDFEFDRGNRKCAGLWLLGKDCLVSAKKVLENLDLFSPFTHQYGFAPITKMDGNTLIVDGKAPRTFLGPNNKVPGSPSSSFGASAAPGRTNYFQNDRPYNYRQPISSYTQSEVECLLQSKPLPSRRILEGKYDGRASVSFDVAFSNPTTVPVMDAQFCALMSVLFVYPEAVKVLKQSSIPWKSKIPTSINHTQYLSSLYAGVHLYTNHGLTQFLNANYFAHMDLPLTTWQVALQDLKNNRLAKSSSLASKLTKVLIAGSILGGSYYLLKKKRKEKL